MVVLSGRVNIHGSFLKLTAISSTKQLMHLNLDFYEGVTLWISWPV